MEINNVQDTRLEFPKSCWQTIIDHCNRKLASHYLNGETKECKAFGIVAGKKVGDYVKVERCFPLMNNVRHEEPYKKYLDKMMAEHAVPSETPLAKRGWVADPGELMGIINQCQNDSITMLGAYHMHRVPWEHDRLRETPTTLDTILAEKSRMIMFIVSMVNPNQPVVRAFYEGVLMQELPIAITSDTFSPELYNYQFALQSY